MPAIVFTETGFESPPPAGKVKLYVKMGALYIKTSNDIEKVIASDGLDGLIFTVTVPESPLSPPPAGARKLYVKQDGLYLKTSNDIDIKVGPSAGASDPTPSMYNNGNPVGIQLGWNGNFVSSTSFMFGHTPDGVTQLSIGAPSGTTVIYLKGGVGRIWADTNAFQFETDVAMQLTSPTSINLRSSVINVRDVDSMLATTSVAASSLTDFMVAIDAGGVLINGADIGPVAYAGSTAARADQLVAAFNAVSVGSGVTALVAAGQINLRSNSAIEVSGTTNSITVAGFANGTTYAAPISSINFRFKTEAAGGGVDNKFFDAFAEGAGFRINEIAGRARMGMANLTAGWVDVITSAVSAESRIFLTPQSPGINPVGAMYVSSRIPGYSFRITSSEVTSDAMVAWIIFDPAPGV